jgi:hypothetical protein
MLFDVITEICLDPRVYTADYLKWRRIDSITVESQLQKVSKENHVVLCPFILSILFLDTEYWATLHDPLPNFGLETG